MPVRSMSLIAAAAAMILMPVQARSDLVLDTRSAANQATYWYAATTELTRMATFQEVTPVVLKTGKSNYEDFITPRFTDHARKSFPVRLYGAEVAQDATVPEPPLVLFLTCALVAIGWWGWRKAHGPRRSSGQRPH